MKNVPKVAKKTNIYKQLFVSFFACKWVSMEQKLSHYRRHKFETNPYKARQHDAMYTVMVLLDFFCNFTLTLLIFFFNFRYVLLRSVIVKILPPDPVLR